MYLRQILPQKQCWKVFRSLSTSTNVLCSFNVLCSQQYIYLTSYILFMLRYSVDQKNVCDFVSHHNVNTIFWGFLWKIKPAYVLICLLGYVRINQKEYRLCFQCRPLKMPVIFCWKTKSCIPLLAVKSSRGCIFLIRIGIKTLHDWKINLITIYIKVTIEKKQGMYFFKI